ncbi:MAG: hypothetical protein IJK81_02610 [Selenomonadaceae bacterium]|nr:hypothetical protein [Selenomonadaceae bacterium]
MKKFYLTLVVCFVLVSSQVVSAADFPDIRNIAPDKIILEWKYPSKNDDDGCYEYSCADGNGLLYAEQYIKLLTKNGFKLVGKDVDSSRTIWGFVISNKNLPAVDFYAVPPCHILIEAFKDGEIQIRLAPRITYGD